MVAELRFHNLSEDAPQPIAMAAQMSPEQQALMAMQNQLADARAQINQINTNYDMLRAAHDALNNAAQTAIAQKEARIVEVEANLKSLIFRQQFDLLDSKELKPESFKGNSNEAFKPWQRKMKAFCNSKRTGFRAALEWAEKQEAEIVDLSPMNWDNSEAASPKLQDFLLQILGGNALMLIDKPNLEGRGFESWRLLVQQYAPSGGAYELDSMIALMNLSQCKSLHELPGAVAKFERDVDAYERRSGRVFPEEFKAPAFLRMIPKSHVSDMRWRFSQGTTDYDTLKASILTYSQHLRFDGAYGRGDNDMQIDALGQSTGDSWSEWISTAQPAEVSAYFEGFSAGVCSENPEIPIEESAEDSTIDALYKKGKGK